VPAFAYRAIEPSGRRVRGRDIAATGAALARDLERRGLLVLDVAEARDRNGTRGVRRGPPGSRRTGVLDVTRALAALIPAGLPIARALGAAAELAPAEVAAAMLAVCERVERGESLAAALGDYPELFSALYVGLVRAGEKSGDIASAFTRLATQLERESQLRSRLTSALLYPALLSVAGGAAVLVLLFFVLPQFAELLRGAGAVLPRSTVYLLAVSTGVRRYWPLLLVLPIAVIALFATNRRADGRVKRFVARALLALPVAGAVRRDAVTARFARLVGVLLGGGAPLLAAIDASIESVADPLTRDDAVRIREQVRAGVMLHRAVAASALFPPLLAQLVAIGEESGRLGEFITKAADVFEERTERATTRLVALAEPAMIVVFGGLVGFVALSLFQAIYSINAKSFR
jgi:general secretion pathway protein F